MKRRPTIEISDAGLTLYGRLIGHEPTMREFLQAVPYEPDRRFAGLDETRELLVFDSNGMWGLSEQDPDLMLAIGLFFERPTWRREHEKDPKDYFRGLVRLGKFNFVPPIKRLMADKISEQEFANLSFFFTCQGQGVAGITIGFPLNEQKLETNKP